MSRRTPRLRSLACGAGIATRSASAPAGAAEGDERITVTPDEGLADGRIVRVDGSEWPDPGGDHQSWSLWQCRSTFDFFQGTRCGHGRTIPDSEVSSRGRFSVDDAVRRSFRYSDDTPTITCDGRRSATWSPS